jgi:hypothetical protein
MVYRSRTFSDGLDVALTIYLGAYSVVAACFALALYAHMQPSTNHNPGVAAYDPPPRTIISYDLPARLKGEPQTDGYAAAAIEPEQMSPPEQPTKPAAKTEEAKTETKTEAKTVVKAQAKPRHVAARPKERRSPEWDYAGQPFAGSYRAQPFAGNYRPWF